MEFSAYHEKYGTRTARLRAHQQFPQCSCQQGITLHRRIAVSGGVELLWGDADLKL
jgi:hypothetical protein